MAIVDVMNNPWFGGVSGSHGNPDNEYNIGNGLGAGYFNWNAEDLGLGDISSFYQPASNGGDNQAPERIDASALNEFLKTNGLNLNVTQTVPGLDNRFLTDSSGKQVGKTQQVQVAPGWHEALMMQMASAFLSPFGGIAAGGVTGGLGGQLASDATTQAAINQGVSGAFAAGASGAEGSDILRAGATGALGAYSPNMAGYAGITDPNLSSAFNGAIRGGVTSAAGGGDWREGAIQGATPSLGNYAGAQIGDSGMFDDLYDMPGTIGGNAMDEYGETSATMGGYTPTQKSYDQQRMSGQSVPQSQSFGDKLFETLGINEGTSIPGFNSNNIGDWAQGLAGLYQGYRQRRNAKELMGMIGGRRGAYEQDLRRNLARRDAASGRRSDYAGREVALQSALAQLDSRNAPAMMQLQNSYMGGLGNMLQTGLRLGSKLGWISPSYGNVQQVPQVQPGYTGPSLANLGQSGPMDTSTSLFDQYKKNNGRLGG